MDPNLVLISLRVTGDEVVATYANEKEYMQSLETDIARMQAERQLREKEMEAREQAVDLTPQKANAFLLGELKEMQELHKQQLEAFIKQRISEIDAQNKASPRTVQEIRAKGEQLLKKEKERYEQIKAEHEAAVKRLQEEISEIDVQRQENMKRDAEARQVWEQQCERDRQEEQRWAMESQQASYLRMKQAEEDAKIQLRIAEEQHQREMAEGQAAHERSMKEQLEDLEAKRSAHNESMQLRESIPTSQANANTQSPNSEEISSSGHSIDNPVITAMQGTSLPQPQPPEEPEDQNDSKRTSQFLSWICPCMLQ